jgi:hypothetical protein
LSKVRYSWKLFREFVAFSREYRTYWIVPLVLMLGLMAILVVASQVSAPLIYTLF